MTHKEMKYFWVENQSVSDRNPMIFWEVITLKLPLGLHLDCKKWYAGVRKKDQPKIPYRRASAAFSLFFGFGPILV
jgi:hypothetical protein